MNIDVWFHGSFREAAEGRRTIQLADGASLGDLIEWLGQEYGSEFGKASSRVDEYFVMLNNNYCTLPANKNRVLAEGDVVAFIPIITGG